MPTEIIGATEAARRLGISARQARRWCDSGKIVARKIGERGHWRIEWDTDVAGGAILAPVNEFIKKTCVRHGGTVVSNIEWSNRGNYAKELTVKVHGMSREDCIRGIRMISGGMTLDEVISSGNCTSCVGYSWRDNDEVTRTAVHGERDSMDDDDPATKRYLKKILDQLRDLPSFPAVEDGYVPMGWGWRRASPLWSTLPRIDNSATNDLTAFTPISDVSSTSTVEWDSVTVSYGGTTYSIPVEGENNSDGDGEDQLHSYLSLLDPSGNVCIFVPINVEGIETGHRITTDELHERFNLTVHEGEGLFLSADDQAFIVRGVENPRLREEMMQLVENLSEAVDEMSSEASEDIGESPNHDAIMELIANARRDRIRNSVEPYFRRIMRVFDSRPAGVSIERFVQGMESGFREQELMINSARDYEDENTIRALRDGEFYLPVRSGARDFRNMVYAQMDNNRRVLQVEGDIVDGGMYIRNHQMIERRSNTIR